MINTDLKGKIALVTGGTRGIGRAISEELAAAGAKVVALYGRSRKGAESLEEKAKENDWSITTIRGDLTREDTYNDVMTQVDEACPKIDILVHAAASGVHRSPMELSDKHMRFTFDINFFIIHKMITQLKDKYSEGTRLLAITSPGGARTIPHYAAVGSSKGALESLFRHYAVSLAKDGIVANLVCPGMVMTDAVDAFPDLQKRIDTTIEQTPSGKLTTPPEVAATVLFLCSDMAKNIIGQTIVIDGGKTIQA